MPRKRLDPGYAAIGQRIVAARAARAMPQQHLAQAIGYTETMIGKLERGRSGLPSLAAWRIAQALDVPLDWLVAGIGEGPTQTGQDDGEDRSAGSCPLPEPQDMQGAPC